jgi:hypothetical protein
MGSILKKRKEIRSTRGTFNELARPALTGRARANGAGQG